MQTTQNLELHKMKAKAKQITLTKCRCRSPEKLCTSYHLECVRGISTMSSAIGSVI